MFWLVLLSSAWLYYLAKVLLAVWRGGDDKEKAFAHSRSLTEAEVRLSSSSAAAAHDEPLHVAMRRVRLSEFAKCKHARCDDAGACLPVCIQLPNLLMAHFAQSDEQQLQPPQQLVERIMALSTEHREGMRSPATLQHCVGTSVEAFLQRDFVHARAFYLAAHVLEGELTEDAVRRTVDGEACAVGSSEEHLLARLRDRVPCKCLDLQDPTCAWWTAQEEDEAGSICPRWNSTCHACGKRQQQPLPVPCTGCDGLARYCSVRCQKQDAKQHAACCGKQPKWWRG